MKQAVNQIFSSLGCGDIRAASYVFMANGETIIPDYTCTVDKKFETAVLIAEQENLFRDSLYFNYSGGHILARRVFENRASDDIRVKELGFFLKGISFNADETDDYYYHNELSRVFGNNTFPVDYNRFNHNDKANDKFGITPGDCWVDMGKIGEPLPKRIGASLFQPFPAILISNYGVKKGLVHGTLSQNVFYHNYEVCHEENDVTLEIYSSFKDIDALTMEPGRVIIDEWYLGTTDEADDIERIFADYTDVLRE